MARITGPDPSLFRRVPALKGRFTIQDNGAGTLYARIWPKKRSRPLHPTTVAQNDKFRSLQAVAKRVAPEIMIAARSVTHRTALMPRDIITKALIGNLISIHQLEGRIYVPMSTLIEISALLDLITNVPGETLRRGEDIWQGAPGGGGGGGGWITTGNFFSQDSPGFNDGWAFKGATITPVRDITIQQVSCSLRSYPGETYRYAIAELDGSNQVVGVVLSADIVPSPTGFRYHDFDIAADLISGTKYACMVGRVDATPTSGVHVNKGRPGGFPIPMSQSSWCWCQTVGPSIGDTVVETSNNAWIPCAWQIL